jgi:hypothetical protein
MRAVRAGVSAPRAIRFPRSDRDRRAHPRRTKAARLLRGRGSLSAPGAPIGHVWWGAWIACIARNRARRRSQRADRSSTGERGCSFEPCRVHHDAKKRAAEAALSSSIAFEGQPQNSRPPSRDNRTLIRVNPGGAGLIGSTTRRAQLARVVRRGLVQPWPAAASRDKAEEASGTGRPVFSWQHRRSHSARSERLRFHGMQGRNARGP